MVVPRDASDAAARGLPLPPAAALADAAAAAAPPPRLMPQEQVALGAVGGGQGTLSAQAALQAQAAVLVELQSQRRWLQVTGRLPQPPPPPPPPPPPHLTSPPPHLPPPAPLQHTFELELLREQQQGVMPLAGLAAAAGAAGTGAGGGRYVHYGGGGADEKRVRLQRLLEKFEGLRAELLQRERLQADSLRAMTAWEQAGAPSTPTARGPPPRSMR